MIILKLKYKIGLIKTHLYINNIQIYQITISITNMIKFSEEKLIDCLNDKAGFATKYKQFKEAFIAGKQQYIHKSILVFKKLFENPQVHPMTKIHIFRALKQGFETGCYQFILLLQAQLLPYIKEIAKFRKGQKDENRGKTYFTEKLLDKSNDKIKDEYQKIGNSYFRFAMESIEAWAILKPKYIFFDSDLDIDSQFVKIFKELKEVQKISFIEKKSYYKGPEYYEKYLPIIKNGKGRIEDQIDEFCDFYAIILIQSLQSQEKFNSEDMKILKKILQIGDQYLLEQAIKIIRENLIDKSQPMTKLLSIRLLNDLFKLGEYTIIDEVSKMLPDIVSFIDSIDSKDKSLKRGEKIFKAEDTKMNGLKYYSILLKSIICWSNCIETVPFSSKKQDSKFKETYLKLKDVKKYDFPILTDQEIKDYKMDFMNNLNKNKTKNQILSSENESDGQLEKKQKTSSQMQIPAFEGNDVRKLIQTHKQIYKNYELLKPEDEEDDKQWIVKAIDYGQKFTSKFEDLLEAELEADDFDEIAKDGYDFIDKNKLIKKIFNSKSLNYKEGLIKIKNIIKNNMGETPGGDNLDISGISISKIQASPQKEMLNNKKTDEIIQKKINEEQANQIKILQQQRKKELQEKQKQQRKAKELEQLKKKQLQAKKQEEKRREQEEFRKELERKNQQKLLQQRRQEQLQKKRLEEEQRKRQLQKKRRQEQEQQNRKKLLLQQQKRQEEKRKEQQRRREQQERQRKQQKRKQEQAKRLKQIQEEKKQQERVRQELRKKQQQRKQQQLLLRNNKKNLDSSEKQSQPESLKKLPTFLKVPNPPQSKSNLNVFDSELSLLNQQQGNNSKKSSVKDFPISNNLNSAQGGFSLKKKANKIEQSQIPSEINFNSPEYIKNEENILDSGEFYNKSKRIIVPSLPMNNFNKISEITQKNSQNSSIPKLLETVPIKIQSKRQQNQEYYQHKEEDTLIHEPYLSPMDNSYYEMKEIAKSRYATLLNQANPSFKKCMQSSEFLIPSKTFSGKQQMFWLQQDANQVLNPLTRSVLKSQSNKSLKNSNLIQNIPTSKVTLPELLAQRSQKFQKEIITIQDQHKRQIQFWQNKVKKLQNELKEKEKALTQQQQEILTLRDSYRGGTKSEYKSQPPQQMQYLYNENNLLRNKLEKNQLRSQYETQKYGPNSNIHSSEKFQLSLKQYKSTIKEPKGRLFNSEKYAAFLEFSDSKLKKLMLKNKELILKNERIEVGSIISKDSTLKIALFIQTQRNITDFKLNILNKGSFSIQSFPQKIASNFQPQKQEKIILSFQVPLIAQIPYMIPAIQLKYKLNDQQQIDVQQLPCTFNRFVEYRELTPQEFKRNFKNFDEKSIIRGEEIVYNRKIIKDYTTFKQLIPKFQLLNPYKQKSFFDGKSKIKYGVEIIFNKSIRFLLKLNIKPNYQLYFQAVNQSEPFLIQESTKIIEFLISTFNKIFVRELQLRKPV